MTLCSPVASASTAVNDKRPPFSCSLYLHLPTYRPPQLVQGQQLDDLNRARAYLCDIASRQRKHCKVYPTVKKGVAHVISEWGKYKVRHRIETASQASLVYELRARGKAAIQVITHREIRVCVCCA